MLRGGEGGGRRHPLGAGGEWGGHLTPLPPRLGPAQQDWEGNWGSAWLGLVPLGARLAGGAGSRLKRRVAPWGAFGMPPAPVGTGTFCLPVPEWWVRRLRPSRAGGPCSWPRCELSGGAAIPPKWSSPSPAPPPLTPAPEPG